MYHSKKIGVFVSHIYGRYQSELCQGIIDKASTYGYLIDIFSSNDGENLGNYSMGENSILCIPNFDTYVGIIFASGTYPIPDLREEIRTALKEKCHCPIVEVGQFPSDYPTIMLDNDSPTEQLVEHLIKQHQYKRICYLGNKIEKNYSDKRYDYYEKAMSANQLSVSEQDHIDSDYQYDNIEQALDYFMQNTSKPDAIICYNDRMALHLMAVLLHRGYRIPEDIAVTGCDTLEFGQNINPLLTSVTFPIKEIGNAAIDTLIKIIDDETISATTVIKAVPHIGATCGCLRSTGENPFFYPHRLMNQIETMEQSMIADMNMSSTLQGMTDLDEGMETLGKYVRHLENYREFYLCLYSDWDFVPSKIRKIAFAEEKEEDSNTIILKYGIKDGKLLSECSFNRRDSLPDFIYKNSSSAYIYSPLFFGNLKFGYVAISFHNNQVFYNFNFMTWLMNVNSMLKHICDTKHMGLLVDRLELIYMKDELTGFYNSHGFYEMAEQLISRAHKEAYTLMAGVIDLDRLHTFPNHSDTKDRNFAIQVIGNALDSALEEGAICARFEDGRFYLLLPDCGNEQAVLFFNKVRKYLDHYNKLQAKSYFVHIHYGYSIQDVDSTFYLPNLIKQAEKSLDTDQEYKSK